MLEIVGTVFGKSALCIKYSICRLYLLYELIYRQWGRVKPELGLLLSLKTMSAWSLIWFRSFIPIQLGVWLLIRFFKESLLDPDWDYYPNSTWIRIIPNSYSQFPYLRHARIMRILCLKKSEHWLVSRLEQSLTSYLRMSQV